MTRAEPRPLVSRAVGDSEDVHRSGQETRAEPVRRTDRRKFMQLVSSYSRSFWVSVPVTAFAVDGESGSPIPRPVHARWIKPIEMRSKDTMSALSLQESGAGRGSRPLGVNRFGEARGPAWFTSRDARLLSRLKTGLPVTESDLTNASKEFGPIAARILAVPIADRPAITNAWLDEFPSADAEAIKLSVIDTDPEQPPEPLLDPDEARARSLGIDARMTRASEIVPRTVEWLWTGRVPIGMLSLFAGDPKLGKSYVTLTMAAAVSRGSPLPGGDVPPGPSSAIILSAEDDPARTIVPRLVSAGADLSRIHLFQSVITDTGRESPLCLDTDLAALAVAARRQGDCRLILIDPISAYLGRVDDHRNADLRSVLAPLSEMAERLGIAVVLVSHLSKASGTNGKHRVMGSIAYVGACRANFLFVRDRTDPTAAGSCSATTAATSPRPRRPWPTPSRIAETAPASSSSTHPSPSPSKRPSPTRSPPGRIAGRPSTGARPRNGSVKSSRAVPCPPRTSWTPPATVASPPGPSGAPRIRSVSGLTGRGSGRMPVGSGRSAARGPLHRHAHRWPRISIGGHSREVAIYEKGGHLWGKATPWIASLPHRSSNNPITTILYIIIIFFLGRRSLMETPNDSRLHRLPLTSIDGHLPGVATYGNVAISAADDPPDIVRDTSRLDWPVTEIPHRPGRRGDRPARQPEEVGRVGPAVVAVPVPPRPQPVVLRDAGPLAMAVLRLRSPGRCHRPADAAPAPELSRGGTG